MLQNLLPKKQKRKNKQEYFLRLAIVSSFLLSGAFFVGLVGLLPSYVKILDELSTKKGEITARQESSKDDKALSAEVVQTAEMLDFLEEGLRGEKVTDLINETLLLRPDGITVVGYSYDLEKRTLVLQGIAATRDLVAPYARKLEASELFEEVPVPFSDLAKNTNLEFLLTLKLKEAK